MTRQRILNSHQSVSDVLVHVDVEDNPDHDLKSQNMADREELTKALSPLLAGLPEPQRILLHYLDDGVEAEVHLPRDTLENAMAVSRAEHEICQQLTRNPLVSALSINYRQRVFPAKGH